MTEKLLGNKEFVEDLPKVTPALGPLILSIAQGCLYGMALANTPLTDDAKEQPEQRPATA